jgi:hypothetical protein
VSGALNEKYKIGLAVSACASRGLKRLKSVLTCATRKHGERTLILQVQNACKMSALNEECTSGMLPAKSLGYQIEVHQLMGSLGAGTTVNLRALGIPNLRIKIVQMAGLVLHVSPAICARFSLSWLLQILHLGRLCAAQLPKVLILGSFNVAERR